MKHINLPLFCLILLFSPCISPGALEFEVLGGVNNMTLDQNSLDISVPDNKTFSRFYSIGKLSLRGEMSESIFFDISYERDNIFINSVSISLFNRTDYFRFQFGPIIGMGDKLETPSVGIGGSIELTYPGIVFLSLGGSSTLGSENQYTSNSFRESGEAKLGFWLPNLIMTFSANTKRMTRNPEANISSCDTLTRFQASADFYAKNVPVLLCLNAGYELYSRSYIKSGTETKAELKAWYAGADLSLQISKPLGIRAGFELPFHTTASPSSAQSEAWNLFKATFGLVFTIF